MRPLIILMTVRSKAINKIHIRINSTKLTIANGNVALTADGVQVSEGKLNPGTGWRVHRLHIKVDVATSHVCYTLKVCSIVRLSFVAYE